MRKAAGCLRAPRPLIKERAVSVDHLSPTALRLYVCCVSASKPPENGRSMAASDQTIGTCDQAPDAEALGIDELHRRDSHSTFTFLATD